MKLLKSLLSAQRFVSFALPLRNCTFYVAFPVWQELEQGQRITNAPLALSGLQMHKIVTGTHTIIHTQGKLHPTLPLIEFSYHYNSHTRSLR